MKIGHGLVALGVLATALSAPAAWAATHSKVEGSALVEGDHLRFDFKVVFPEALHLNLEAPWALEVKSAPGLSVARTHYTKADLDQKLPGFHALTSTKPGPGRGVLDYTLTAFVCTNDKSLCYRDVLSGSVAWSVP